MKKRLTEQQEFEIMKLVLDKFLWIGVILAGIGIYFMFTKTIEAGIYFMLTGVIIMVLFAWIIVKEFEIIESKRRRR